MAKRRADLSLSKKAEILEKYRSLPKCSQRAAAEQLNNEILHAPSANWTGAERI